MAGCISGEAHFNESPPVAGRSHGGPPPERLQIQRASHQPSSQCLNADEMDWTEALSEHCQGSLHKELEAKKNRRALERKNEALVTEIYAVDGELTWLLGQREALRCQLIALEKDGEALKNEYSRLQDVEIASQKLFEGIQEDGEAVMKESALRKWKEAASELLESEKKCTALRKEHQTVLILFENTHAQLETLLSTTKNDLKARRENLLAQGEECARVRRDIIVDSAVELLFRCSQGPSSRGAWELWRFTCRLLVLYCDVAAVERNEFDSYIHGLIIELRPRLSARFIDSSDLLTGSIATLIVHTLGRQSNCIEIVNYIIDGLCKDPESIFSLDYIWTVPPLRLTSSRVRYTSLTSREMKIAEDYRGAWTTVLEQIHHKLANEGHDGISSGEAAKMLIGSAPAYAKTIKWSERLIFELRFLFRDLWRKKFACWDAAAVKFMWIEWIQAGGPQDPKREFMSDYDKADIEELRWYSHQSRSIQPAPVSFSASHWWLTVDCITNSGVRNGLELAPVLKALTLLWQSDLEADEYLLAMKAAVAHVEIFNPLGYSAALAEWLGEVGATVWRKHFALGARLPISEFSPLHSSQDTVAAEHTETSESICLLILERCIVGLFNLAATLQRPFTQEEGLLAVELVSLCTDQVFRNRKKRPRSLGIGLACWSDHRVFLDLQMRHRWEVPDDAGFLVHFNQQADTDTKRQWVAIWRQLIVNDDRSQGRFLKTYLALRSVKGFFFHNEWQFHDPCDYEEPPRTRMWLEYVTAEMIKRLEMAKDTQLMRRQLRQVDEQLLNRRFGASKTYAGKLRRAYAYAESWRGPGSSIGAFMPLVESMSGISSPEGDGLFGSEIDLYVFQMELLRTHVVYWELLRKSGLSVSDPGTAVRAAASFLSELHQLRISFSFEDESDWRSSEQQVKALDYAGKFDTLLPMVRNQLWRLNVHSLEGKDGTSGSGLELQAWMTCAETITEAVLANRSIVATIGGSLQVDQLIGLIERRGLKNRQDRERQTVTLDAVGVRVDVKSGRDFEKEIDSVFERVANQIEKLQEWCGTSTTVWIPEEDNTTCHGGFFFSEVFVPHFLGPLNELFVAWGLQAKGNGASDRAWEDFLSKKILPMIHRWLPGDLQHDVWGLGQLGVLDSIPPDRLNRIMQIRDVLVHAVSCMDMPRAVTSRLRTYAPSVITRIGIPDSSSRSFSFNIKLSPTDVMLLVHSALQRLDNSGLLEIVGVGNFLFELRVASRGESYGDFKNAFLSTEKQLELSTNSVLTEARKVLATLFPLGNIVLLDRIDYYGELRVEHSSASVDTVKSAIEPASQTQETLVRKFGFNGLGHDIDKLTDTFVRLTGKEVSSWRADELLTQDPSLIAGRNGVKLSNAALIPFEKCTQLLSGLKLAIVEAGLTVNDHSGFVVWLRGCLTDPILTVFDACVAPKVVGFLGTFLGTLGIENTKTKKKAVVAAKEGLSQWFSVELEHATPVDDVLSLPHAVAHVESGPYKDSTSVQQPQLPEQSVQHDDACGLYGERVEELKAQLPGLLVELFDEMKSLLEKKGVISLGRLDAVAEKIQVEYLDLGLRLESSEKWFKYLTEVVMKTAGNLFNGDPGWAASYVAAILVCEDGGINSRRANARKALAEDAKSPFCKRSTVKQADGTFKCRIADPMVGISHQGFLIFESKVGELDARVHGAIRELEEALEIHREVFPKPLSTIDQFSDAIELVRFDLAAVVESVGEVREYLAKTLSEAGYNDWHAQVLAHYVCIQFEDYSEQGRLKADLCRTLLTDRQSEFAPDPYSGWRPLISDSRLKVPQLPRIEYRESGFSLQSRSDSTAFFNVLKSVLTDHLSRWHRLSRPYPWSLVDSIIREFRTEAFKHLLVVEDAATLTITLEDRVLSGSLIKLPGIARSRLTEYLVEMLRVRPDPKRVAHLKQTVISASKNFFTAKESLVPRPAQVDLGFLVGSALVPFETEQRVSDFVANAVSHAVAGRIGDGILANADIDSLKVQVQQLVKVEQISVISPKSFKRFLYPVVFLGMKSLVDTSSAAETLLDMMVSWFSDGQSPCEQALSTTAPQSLVPQISSGTAAVFDLSKPGVYLEWRFVVLSKITLSLLGTDAATQILLAAVDLEDVRVLEAAIEGNAAMRFHAILGFLDSRFDNEEARNYILSELAHEQDKVRRARLEEIRVLFLDISSGERTKIAASIAAESDAVRKSVSKVLFGFGDTRVEVFKARVNSFMAFLPPPRVRFTC